MSEIMVKKFKVCVRCVMDTTDSKIRFDERGICDHCLTFEKDILPRWNYGLGKEHYLSELRDKIKITGKRKEFDCIIGMSGGIDSSYLVYIAKEKLGLRPLVFHVDAGWNSPEAVSNIEAMVDKLDLDLHTEVIDWKEMRDLQLAYFKAGVSNIDTPQDHAFFATMYKFAAKYGIRYILTGGNYSTECIRNPIEWMYYQSDSSQLKDIHKKFGSIPLKNFPLCSILWHKVWLPYVRQIKVVRPLDLMPYIQKEAIESLSTEFGWQPYRQKHFESRFTKFYEGHWLPTKFGFDTRKVQLSSLILTAQMKRHEALNILEKPPLSSKEIEIESNYVASKLGIERVVLDEFLNSPNKTRHDYRSQEFIYDWGASVLRGFGLELGGKR